MHPLSTCNDNKAGVLAALRSLIPARQISFQETLRIAELQATKLLELHHSLNTPAENTLITELPNLQVRYDATMPVSGSSGWNGKHWVISLNSNESLTRQRFTLAHEYKHITDHGYTHRLYSENQAHAATQAEQAADYFAGCLLIPKRLLKHYWYNISQNITHLANIFDVSVAAIQVRLAQTGITETTTRCASTSVGTPRYPETATALYPAAPSTISPERATT